MQLVEDPDFVDIRSVVLCRRMRCVILYGAVFSGSLIVGIS